MVSHLVRLHEENIKEGMDNITKYGIVLNRMYAGDYLSSNLGHEVINLYQADNGGNYIYLNSTGDFVKAHQGQVGYMLFVKYYGIGEVEVIGMACGLHDVYKADQKFVNKYAGVSQEVFEQQLEYIRSEGGISYGGVSILDIFGESGQQSVFITYKADKIYIPKENKRLFIRFHTDKIKLYEQEPSDIIVELDGYQQAMASLKQYIYAEGTYKGDLTKQHIAEKQEDYRKIRRMLIDNKSLWRESNNRVDDELSSVNSRKVSLFDICQIQNDENKISNALAYFMLREEYRNLWCEFFKRFDIELGKNYTITREETSKIKDSKIDAKKSGGRIDLIIRTKDRLIVIENKIKSDINSIKEDGEGKQLRRYYNYANWLAANIESADYGKILHFVIITPKYNIPNIEDKDMRKVYKIITYADLYNFLSEREKELTDDENFVAFREAMYRHTHDNVNDYLYYEMQDKFLRRIKEKTTI